MKTLRITAVALFILAITTGAFATGRQETAETGPRQAELRVFMSFPRFQDQFESYYEQFSQKILQEQGTDVRVRLEMPQAEQANQILKARLASNDAPDVYTLHAIADIPTFYRAGYLADLSDEPFVEGFPEMSCTVQTRALTNPTFPLHLSVIYLMQT